MNGFRQSSAWTCDDHHPRIFVTPLIFVLLSHNVPSFTSLPMSAGMVPGDQRRGRTKLVVVRGRKTKSGKNKLIFADHRPGNVIEPFTCDDPEFIAGLSHLQCSSGRATTKSASRGCQCLAEWSLGATRKAKKQSVAIRGGKTNRQK